MPKRYERGCINYVTIEYPMRIAFPENMVICDICPFCHTENSGTRFRCTETGEILPFHNHDTGRRCPLGIQPPQTEAPEDDDP